MSDEFDKEAEREKLREKYGDDEEDRQATERMSDLLLKGATMTNTHCGTCGDPLFRQNGVTFCPSCHGGPEGVEGTGVEPEGGAGGQRSEGGQPPAEPGEAGGATEIDVSSPGETGGAEPADGPEEPVPTGTGERATPPRQQTDAPEPGRRADRDGPRTPPSRSDPAESNDPGPGRRAPAADRTTTADRGPGGNEADARESLVAALERFSAEAAAADDPRYARECLQAAREAADALAALRR